MDQTWTKHGSNMDQTWITHGSNVEQIWIKHGSTMDQTCSPGFPPKCVVKQSQSPVFEQNGAELNE